MLRFELKSDDPVNFEFIIKAVGEMNIIVELKTPSLYKLVFVILFS